MCWKGRGQRSIIVTPSTSSREAGDNWGMRTDLSKERKTPNRLYKYRSFSNRTLDQLVADQLFFADPNTFNDPLDTKPSLATDLDAEALADILGRLVEERISAEMSAAARTIKYRGPKTQPAQSQRGQEAFYPGPLNLVWTLPP
jgi:hypothetical protein